MIDIENYNNSNIFAKILRKEINSKKVYEDEFAFAFEDISPQAPTHILIIPKAQYCSLNDFLEKADDQFLVGFMKAIKKVVDVSKLNNGYRLITNIVRHLVRIMYYLLLWKSFGNQIERKSKRRDCQNS